MISHVAPIDDLLLPRDFDALSWIRPTIRHAVGPVDHHRQAYSPVDMARSQRGCHVQRAKVIHPSGTPIPLGFVANRLAVAILIFCLAARR